MSQRELAEPGYTHAYVSTIESGKREPSRAAVEYFAVRLGRDVDELLSGRPPDLIPRIELDLREARRSASAGELDTAEATCNRLAAEAAEYELPRLESKALQGAGLCRELRGDLDGAIELYERSEASVRHEPTPIKVEAIAARARCLQMKGENRTAIYALEQALEGLEQEGLLDPDALVRVHTSLVAAYFEEGAYKKAAASAESALSLAPRTTNPEHQANMHLNVARMFLAQGRAEDAHASLRRAEDLFRELELLQEVARCHHSRGYIFSRQGEPDQARQEFMRAVEGFEQAQAPIMVARSITELARLERLQGDVNSAEKHLHQARDLLKEQDVFDLGEVYRELGLCFFSSDPNKAETYLQDAARLFKDGDQHVEYAATARMIGDLLMERGDTEAAVEAYRAGITTIEERL